MCTLCYEFFLDHFCVANGESENRSVQSAVCVPVFNRNNVNLISKKAKCSATPVGRQHRNSSKSSAYHPLTVIPSYDLLNRSCGNIAFGFGIDECKVAIFHV